MEQKAKPETSLLVLLMAVAALVLFLPLKAVSLFPDELTLLEKAEQLRTSGIATLFERPDSEFATNTYAYLISVNLNVFNMSSAWAVRTPAAAIVWILTIAIYHFRGKKESRQNAFFAALLFLSSYSICSQAYHARPIIIATLFLIAALGALYHWINNTYSRMNYTLVIAAAFATLFLGVLAQISIAIVGTLFMLIQNERKVSRYVKLYALLIVSSLAATFSVAFIANNTEIGLHILGIGQITEPLLEYSRLNMLATQLILSIFPWSIPVIIALIWLVIHPRKIRDRFLGLSLIKQFGVILFILTLPIITALNGLSMMAMVAAAYFNMPIISHFLTSQTHNHSVTWRITGSIFGVVVAGVTILYIMAMAGISFPFAGYTLQTPRNWTFGKIALIVAIVTSLYSLIRNHRTIQMNNRYLYNIVVIYTLAQLLYKAYINPYIITL